MELDDNSSQTCCHCRQTTAKATFCHLCGGRLQASNSLVLTASKVIVAIFLALMATCLALLGSCFVLASHCHSGGGDQANLWPLGVVCYLICGLMLVGIVKVMQAR